MTLHTLIIGLVIWLAFLLACLVGAWVKLGRGYDTRTVQVLPVTVVLICVSLILFFVLRAMFHV